MSTRNRIVQRGALAGVVLFLSIVRPAAPQESSVQVRQILALTYPEGPTISVRFQGTSRLPGASGEAKVERKKGMTEIEIELDEMKPATAFGGDYNTYVLWIVSPEGQVDNVGEFILQGNRSKLDVSTPLETFGMLVSAEPHFLVGLPSRFVVLENTEPTVDLGPLKVSELRYRGHEGIYRFDNESLAEVAGSVLISNRPAPRSRWRSARACWCRSRSRTHQGVRFPASRRRPSRFSTRGKRGQSSSSMSAPSLFPPCSSSI